MHIDAGNLMVVIGCIVVDAFIGVVTRTIQRDFVFIFFYFTTAFLLGNGIQDMEELTDTFQFTF